MKAQFPKSWRLVSELTYHRPAASKNVLELRARWLAAVKNQSHGGMKNGRTIGYNNQLVRNASLPIRSVDGSVCDGADVTGFANK